MAAALIVPLASTNVCVICQTLTAQKPKPGILLCLGCQQLFCYQHVGQYRQHLADQLDTIVVNERNDLLEIISKLEENCDQYTEPQMKEINDWELRSHEAITQIAENARRNWHEMALNECDNLKARFTLLSAELNDTRETDSYFEKDIAALKHKFYQLKHDIENIGLKVDVNNELQTMELINVKKKPSGSDSSLDQLLLTQKPVKSINVRNTGILYAVNESVLAFAHQGAREIDLYNIVDGSLKTMSRLDDWTYDVCYSTYLQSFLYFIRRRRPKRFDLYQWSIASNREPVKLDLNNTAKISAISCYETYLILISYSNIIEKWKLNDLKLDARWRTPMSCEAHESIKTIRKTSQCYALVISKVDSYHFQLQNSAISVVGNVKIEYDYPLDLISLPNESGWLLFIRHCYNKASYVIDNQLNKHEQKYILAANNGMVCTDKPLSSSEHVH